MNAILDISGAISDEGWGVNPGHPGGSRQAGFGSPEGGCHQDFKPLDGGCRLDLHSFDGGCYSDLHSLDGCCNPDFHSLDGCCYSDFRSLDGCCYSDFHSLDGCCYSDFPSLDGCCRYCDTETAEVFRKSLKTIGPNGIHLIDTGDYHYLTLFFLELIREPFSLVLLDNHPDDQMPAFGDEVISCGGWVETARRTLPLMKQVLWNGAGSGIAFPVYISIDIDVLSKEYATTGWSQGDMTGPELLSLISRLKTTHRIIGADICGGLSALQGATDTDLALNRRTKEQIIRALE